MYLSQLHPRRDALRAFFYGGHNEYRLHQLVWKAFARSKDQPRNFLYRIQQGKSLPFFYTLSDHPPEGTELFDFETKTFSPQLQEGQVLSFLVRVNPTIARKFEGGGTRRHDVVMNLKSQKKQEGTPYTMAELIQEAGHQWLEKRAESNGFLLANAQHLQIHGYQKHTLFKGKGKRPITFCTLDYEGILKVQNLQAFQAMLAQGLGPSKGFGCGMMMIRPAF